MRTNSSRGMIHHFTPVPKGAHFSAERSAMRRLPLSLLALAAFTGLSSATVTPYCWIRGGESGLMTDSSGLNHGFNAGYSDTLGTSNPAAVLAPNGAGGPLGTTSAVSTVSIRWGFYNSGVSGMWIESNGAPPTPAQFGLPAQNWSMEAWVLPVDDGASGGGTNSQLVSTGSNQHLGTPGGAAFRSSYNGDNTITLTAVDIGQSNIPIGDPVITDNGTWIHLAVVNTNGTDTFYVNGVAKGLPLENASAPSGCPYIGSGADTHEPFNGYLDEIRYCTFQAGQFQVSDLFARPQGPNIIRQPETNPVWEGAPALFEVLAVYDAQTTYQWRLGGNPIAGQTTPEYYLPSVTSTDNNKVFSVVVSNHGIDLPSKDATLTVVPVETANAAFYRDAVQSEPSLLAFFPVDGDNATSLTNTKDPARNATLAAGSSFDGRTSRAFGERALRLKGNSEAVIPANPFFEFSAAAGGTVEAIVYLAPGGGPGSETLFSVASGSASAFYQIQISSAGNSLTYKNDDILQLPVSWGVTPSLIGRRAHVAIVFGTDSTITAYVDGQSLGTKPLPGHGVATGLPANIGSSGNLQEGWNGTIDELAIYGGPLSAARIAIHNSRFVNGTAALPPVITEQPSTVTKDLLAGGAPVFAVKATGTAPLSYQWKLNNAPITGNPTATTAKLILDNSTTAMSGSYTVSVTNDAGEDVSDPVTVNFTAPPDVYAAKVLADNPSAYWRLNETTGTVLKDSAGGLNGTYASTVERGVTPRDSFSDPAAHFSGTGSPIPNAIVPYTPILNPSGEFTVELWAKPDVPDSKGTAMIANQDRAAGRSGFVVYQGFDGDFWGAHFGDSPVNSTVTRIIGTSTPQVGVWHHIVVEWDGVNTGHLFVNGVEEIATAGLPLVVNLTVPFEIGSRYGGQLPFQGAIDEVAFYNHRLSLARIAAHAQTLPPAAAVLNAPTYANGKVTLTWTGPANLVLQESTDLNTWTTVQGATSGYTADVTGKKYYRLAQP
jgi:hypothetical protein